MSTNPSAASLGLLLALTSGKSLTESVRDLKASGIGLEELYDAIADHAGHEEALRLVAQWASRNDAPAFLKKGLAGGANPWVVYGRAHCPAFRGTLRETFDVPPDVAESLEALYDLGGHHRGDMEAMELGARSMLRHDSPWTEGVLNDLLAEAPRNPRPASAFVLALGYFKRLAPVLATLARGLSQPTLADPVARAIARMAFPAPLAEALRGVRDESVRAALRNGLAPYRETRPAEVAPFLDALACQPS